MLRLFQRNLFRVCFAWTALVLFIPGMSVLCISYAFEDWKSKEISCFPKGPIEPFPNSPPLF